MESLQKAVAKELLKRQRATELRQFDDKSTLLSNSSAANLAAEVDEPTAPIATTTEATTTEATTRETLTESARASETTVTPSTDSESWLPDEESIAAAVQLAESRLVKQSEVVSESTETTAASSTQIETHAAIKDVLPRSHSADSNSDDIPASLHKDSDDPTIPAPGELPDAFKLLLEASTNLESQPIENPANSNEPNRTPNPFGPQRRRAKPLKAEHSYKRHKKAPEQPLSSQPTNSTTTNSEEVPTDPPKIHRSMRSWFTPRPTTDPDPKENSAPDSRN